MNTSGDLPLRSSKRRCTSLYIMEVCAGKRQQNRLKRRAVIVEVATRAFLEQGYAATSMSAIADELGGSKATLWSYFASKEDLFIAVVDGQVDLFAAEIEVASEPRAFSVEGLHHYCLTFLRTLMKPEAVALFRVIMGDGGRFPEINSIFHLRGPARFYAYLSGFLASRFAAEEAARLALLINATMAGWRSQILTRPDPVHPGELEQFVDDLIAHLRLTESLPD
ncbi:TetR/AcrR family transcriptional regulator [Novosphingobium sp. HII-3]|uniref:TetR/AcrR family transcriptional regulator n=1 Tax=Novosphingobium sp. HII-3 TaxID=2075565 RepID=UPI001E4A9741|nr:TetR/AcrR family transcriptional regulator [Novosphingobium sp. HII-3]